MREVVLDTETTGFNPQKDRIVEIGCIELENHLPTGRSYQKYINPECQMPVGAYKVHGLTDEFLSDKPKMCEVIDSFLEFIADSTLIIHNAKFDKGFLDSELIRCGRKVISNEIQDTLLLARKKYPNMSNSLDALCKRYNIDNSSREFHGALLDSDLLAEVYLELKGGRQRGFSLDDGFASNGAEKFLSEREFLVARDFDNLWAQDYASHREFVSNALKGGFWKYES